MSIEPFSANSLTSAALMNELQRRDLQPKGFFSDDAKTLQKVFDEEHGARVKEAEDAHESRRRALRRQRARHRHRLVVLRLLKDEAATLNAAGDASDLLRWLDLLANDAAPAAPSQLAAVLRSASEPPAAGRCVAKALWGCHNITSLDVGRAKLDDGACAYVARAVAAPGSSIARLELDGNAAGPLCCAELAHGLPSAALSSLSLEDNDLTRGGTVAEPFGALCGSLRKAKRLRRLGLWRCGLGAAAGTALAEGVAESPHLVLVEAGGNDVDAADLRTVDDTLRANRDRQAERDAAVKRAARDEKKAAAARAAEEENARKEKEVEDFIERRKAERKEAREKARVEAAAAEERAAKEREEREVTRREALAAAAATGKKGRGKKKK